MRILKMMGFTTSGDHSILVIMVSISKNRMQHNHGSRACPSLQTRWMWCDGLWDGQSKRLMRRKPALAQADIIQAEISPIVKLRPTRHILRVSFSSHADHTPTRSGRIRTTAVRIGSHFLSCTVPLRSTRCNCPLPVPSVLFHTESYACFPCLVRPHLR